MDACQNPSLVHLSGFFQSQNPDAPATSLVPSFTTCTTTLHNDILSVPSDESITSYLGGVAWNQKQNSKLHWRGSSAGALYDVEHPHWNLTHRIRLVEATNGKDGEVYVLPGAENRLETVGSCERVETGWLNEDWMDVKFVGRPMGCQGGKGGQSLCGELEKRFEFKPKWEDEEQTAQWKYLIDVSCRTLHLFRKDLLMKRTRSTKLAPLHDLIVCSALVRWFSKPRFTPNGTPTGSSHGFITSLSNMTTATSTISLLSSWEICTERRMVMMRWRQASGSPEGSGRRHTGEGRIWWHTCSGSYD